MTSGDAVAAIAGTAVSAPAQLLGLGGAASWPGAWPLLWTVVLPSCVTRPGWTTFVVLLSRPHRLRRCTGAACRRYAAGLVWLLLFGGLSAADGTDRTDAAARDTLIPRQVWKAGFVVLALFCVWKGFVLLAP